MSRKLRLTITGAALGLVSLSAALACGDKLVALGGGVPFERIHVTRHSGQVILYLNPETRLRIANAEMRLDTALTRAGHTVRTVTTRADLDHALQEARADLVLMDWADAMQLNARLTDKIPTLPVIYGAGPDAVAQAASQNRCVIEANKGKGSQLVRAIEHILEGQGKGVAVDCVKIGGRGVS
jgi:CheY-like chemotaxis protein